MYRFVFFLLGFGLTVVGALYIIIYLNLTTMGYNFLEYVKFIIRHIECWNLVLGLIIMHFSLPREDIDEQNIRCCIKF